MRLTFFLAGVLFATGTLTHSEYAPTSLAGFFAQPAFAAGPNSGGNPRGGSRIDVSREPSQYLAGEGASWCIRDPDGGCTGGFSSRSNCDHALANDLAARNIEGVEKFGYECVESDASGGSASGAPTAVDPVTAGAGTALLAGIEPELWENIAGGTRGGVATDSRFLGRKSALRDDLVSYAIAITASPKLTMPTRPAVMRKRARLHKTQSIAIPDGKTAIAEQECKRRRLSSLHSTRRFIGCCPAGMRAIAVPSQFVLTDLVCGTLEADEAGFGCWCYRSLGDCQADASGVCHAPR